MAGALLDTNALYWLVSGAPMSNAALVAIGEAQAVRSLYVSPISGWELALAARKPQHKNPPDLGLASPSKWFSTAISLIQAELIPIRRRIAFAAAAIVAETGHGDPGDCYIMATAKVRRATIITRDDMMMQLGAAGYLNVIAC